MPRNVLPSEEECYAAYVQTPPRLDVPRSKRKKLNDLTWPELKVILDTKDWEEAPPTRERTPRICPHCHHYQQGPSRGKSSLSHRCPMDASTNIIHCTDWTTCPTGFRKGHEDEVDKTPQTEVSPLRDSLSVRFLTLIHPLERRFFGKEWVRLMPRPPMRNRRIHRDHSYWNWRITFRRGWALSRISQSSIHQFKPKSESSPSTSLLLGETVSVSKRLLRDASARSCCNAR
jgi:hypothetical protein